MNAAVMFQTVFDSDGHLRRQLVVSCVNGAQMTEEYLESMSAYRLTIQKTRKRFGSLLVGCATR